MDQYPGRKETKSACPSRNACRMRQFLERNLALRRAHKELYSNMIKDCWRKYYLERIYDKTVIFWGNLRGKMTNDTEEMI